MFNAKPKNILVKPELNTVGPSELEKELSPNSPKFISVQAKSLKPKDSAPLIPLREQKMMQQVQGPQPSDLSVNSQMQDDRGRKALSQTGSRIHVTNRGALVRRQKEINEDHFKKLGYLYIKSLPNKYGRKCKFSYRRKKTIIFSRPSE